MIGAASGTLVGLHRALKARMETVAASLSNLVTKSDALREPNVHHADLPPKVAPTAERYPFLVVRPSRQGTDTVEGADQDCRATIEIEIGTYRDEDDGHLDLFLAIDLIRQSLLGSPVLEDTAYSHIGPLTWDVPFPQPRPEWLGIVTTVWQIPRPERPPEE